jgi:hypothetical protein
VTEPRLPEAQRPESAPLRVWVPVLRLVMGLEQLQAQVLAQELAQELALELVRSFAPVRSQPPALHAACCQLVRPSCSCCPALPKPLEQPVQ